MSSPVAAAAGTAQASEGVDASLLQSPWGDLGRGITLGLVSGFAKLVLSVLNNTTVTNQQALLETVERRAPGRGLLTVCNHTSMFDDPGLFSAALPWRLFWLDPLGNYLRYSLCAKEVCFKNEPLRQFFLSGKTLPIERGSGVHQPSMELAAQALAGGSWVHLFPEGRINYGGRLGPLRWGAGKMVCDATVRGGGRDPVVLPFYHSGMGRVLPLGARGFGVGQQVTITVGEPIDLSDLTCQCGSVRGEAQQQLWLAITQRLAGALAELEQRSPPNVDQSKVVAALAQNQEAARSGTSANAGRR